MPPRRVCRPPLRVLLSARSLALAACLGLAPNPVRAAGEAPYFATGVKIGEVDAASATFWTRLARVDQCGPDFALPGCAGEVQVVCEATEGAPHRVATPWRPVDVDRDFTCQLRVTDLRPHTPYAFTLSARNDAGTRTLAGTLRTAPQPDDPQPVTFVVTTGHKLQTVDAPGQGQRIYPAMQRLAPSFFVHTGDVVYYDNDVPPLARDRATARLHWGRMYNQPFHREFHRGTPSYFIKDDHDLLKNDCWPGQTYGELTFAEGQELFREQCPLGPVPYRKFRWGRDLEIWLLEGRDFRSANNAPDGPDKTILGAAQRAWLTETLRASDATFRLVISATPIVGPDRGSKADNHANDAFRHEGDWLRSELAALPNTYVVCGDRHWQYASAHANGLREFCSGPSTDLHAGGWKPEQRLPEHRFVRVAGGFLHVAVRRDAAGPSLAFTHRDVHGVATHAEIFRPREP